MQNVSNTKEKEVDITYTLNFPRKEVFAAWIDAAALQAWFAPHGCTIKYKKLEIKEGGTFLSCVSNPQFGDCWCAGEYKTILIPEKIVFTMINTDEHGNPIDPASIGMDAAWPGETLVTITFTEVNGKTTIRLKQTVSEVLAKKTGAHPSWIQMLERLEEKLATVGAV